MSDRYCNNQRKVSRFRPQEKSLDNTGSELLKILTMGVMLLVLMLPLLTGVQISTDNSNPIQVENRGIVAAGGPDNLLYIGLPGMYAVTPGATLGMNGFAYVNSAEERIYFVDPISETTIDMALPNSYALPPTLLAADVDDDGDMEFLGIRRVTTVIAAVYIVDFDAGTYIEHTFSGVGGTFFGTGDFNGDTQLDVAILVNNNFLQILDLSTGTTLGTFDSDGILRSYNAIGDFTGATGDQIIVTNKTYTFIINGDGSQALNLSTPEDIREILLFNYDGGFSDIVLIDNSGYATARQGTDLSVIFSTQVGPVSSSNYGVTGNFTGDTQEDIYIQSNGWVTGLFLDGTNGTIIRETPGTIGYGSRLDVGSIDDDPLSDIVTETDLDNPCFVHGVTGEIAYAETLIEGASQIFSYDVDSNSRDDIFIRSSSDLYILLSEYDPPIIHEQPMDPIHPTVVDDIVTFEIFVDEGSAIESADLFVRKIGTTEWTQPHIQLFTPDDETYYAFLVGLEAGGYEYYYEIVDIYLNTGYFGNITHPKSFNITGHLAWEYDKTTYFGPSQSIAYGNESGGNSIIYTLELGTATKTLDLNKYSNEGILLDTYTISFTDGNSFVLFSGMIDGDNLLDPVAMVSSDTQTIAYALHGSSFTLNYMSPSPDFIKTIQLFDMMDGNGDSLDDIYLIETDRPYNITCMDSSGTWTIASLPFALDYALYPKFVAGAKGENGNPGNLTIIRGNTRIEVYNGSDIGDWTSADVAYGAFTKYEAQWLSTMKREGTAKEDFVLGSTYWNGPIPETHLFAYDGGLTGIGDIDEFTISGKDIEFLYPFDRNGDQIDELILHMDDGELTLVSIAGSLSSNWSTSISDATALSGIKTDFDGDMEDEFILFTSEDGLLTAISMDGVVERTAVVGEVNNPIIVGNVDLGLGQDIAAFPIQTGVENGSLGVIRDIDWFYRMDVSFTSMTSEIIQGEAFKSNLTVSNIYGEIVEDASIYVSASYLTSEGQVVNTFGSWFDTDNMLYRADTDGSWSMGVANLSLIVNHQFYHSIEKMYPNAVTIRSNLVVNLQVPDIVQQGDNTSIRVLVSDNLGGIVGGAAVSITIDGVTQSAVLSNQLYILNIAEVQLEAGIHAVEAVATHAYAIGPGVNVRDFEVQVLTANLVVSTDFPTLVQQDNLVSAWFNITDPYGHQIYNAIVSLQSGPERYGLVEYSPGNYRFNHTIRLGLGNQTFDLNVDKMHIFGPPVTQIEFNVTGNLQPNVFYETRVEGGTLFNIHVFVRDKYGPIFLGTSVSIEINGTLYTQINTDGNPDYDFSVPADFLMGPNNFTIFVNATFANQWSKVLTIRAYSDASTSTTIFPEGDWIVNQGERTEFEVFLDDWLGRPVSGASITFYVRALAYNLHEVSPGVYMTNITTIGWAPGEYQYTVAVGHEDIETGDPIQGNITILGSLELFIDFNPDTPMQGGPLLISITVVDAYGNPIPGLEIALTMLNLPTMIAVESEQVGEYTIYIEHLPIDAGYGSSNISIEVNGQFVEPEEMLHPFTLAVAPPVIEAMDATAIGSFAGLSFIISLIGMFVYFRLAPTLRSKGSSKDELEKSVKRMDMLYLLIVLISAAGLVGSMGLYSI
ncbi:hypothetical protein EU528_11760, partial [Candidatus Thorarchaeota archaeon]